MKVLVLSKYDRLAASPRYRFIQYAPYLARHGIELVLSPLFDDRYLERRFRSGEAAPGAVLRAYGRRLRAVVTARRWDLAIVHCELFPYLPSVAERALRASRQPYVYDYDDAIFHMYDQHRSSWVRQLLGDKLQPLVAGARAVMAGSGYLARYAERFNDDVSMVPTVVDMSRYTPRPARAANAPFTVGWIGSPSSSEYLPLISQALSTLARQGPVRLIATGARPFTIPGVAVEVRPWSEATEIADLHEADVGVMPMPDEPWARGKCAFKLIQYMAVGLPTVASPVGANREVVTDQTGLLARTTEEWVASLARLRDDPALRARLGAAGRRRAADAFSLDSQAPRVRAILERAAGA